MLKAINISFGQRSHFFSFEINDNEIIFLVGRNGAGKSSLLLALSGLISLKSGKLIFNDVDISNETEVGRIKRGIRISLEDRQIFPNLTVKENILLGGYKLKKTLRDARYKEVLIMFDDLKEKEFSIARTLSGGQQTQLNIARSLMGNTKLLLLDEPSLGLDPINVKKLSIIVKKFLEEHKVSMLIVDNNLKFIKNLNGKIIKLENGQMNFADNPTNAINMGFFDDFYP